MTPEAIDQYFNERLAEHAALQETAVKEYGLDREDLECWITDSGLGLEVGHPDGSRKKFPVVPIGTYVETAGSWRWAFSDFGYPVEARRRLGTALETAASETGLPVFVDPEAVKCERIPAEALMTVALSHVGGRWFYVLPSHGGKVLAYFAVVGDPVAG